MVVFDLRLPSLVALVLTAAPGEAAAPPSPAELRFFEASIRPLLAEHCFGCHGPEKQRAGLRLDSAEAVRRGSSGGPVIVPGNPDKSLLIQAVRHAADVPKMPPKGQLTAKQLADLTRWVQAGAPFPQKVETGKRSGDTHWAFQPIARSAPPLPQLAGWARNPLDQFILARLEQAGLRPARPAEARTLLRRLTLDLTGLPPTPAEMDAFEAACRDASAGADPLEHAVDRLLASPAYGERWGRHWLDVARYADSNGLDENIAHGNAWRYRDWVVNALNRDLPYDQFLLAQIAGDLLPSDDPAAQRERLIATSFLGLGPKVLAEVDEQKMVLDVVDEQIDAVSRSVLALTITCARCHDHKFDPISTEDYYGLAGIFSSSKTMESTKKIARWYEHSLATPAELAQKSAHEKQLAAQKAAIAAVVAKANEALKATLKAGAVMPKDPEANYPDATKTELKTLRAQLAQMEKAAPELPSTMGVTEGKVADAAVLPRGNYLKPGKIVPRHVPVVLARSNAPSFTPKQSGRLELAQWLVRRDNPLTARVIVNRVWRGHFGQGLVRSIDNFGLLGEKPSHPELLDWLANRFMDDGWSLKKLHRLIVLSSTYRMSSAVAPSAAEKDPENRLLARMPIRRLEAEAIRDSLLAVSGLLDRTQGGPVLHVKNRDFLFDHTSKDTTTYHSKRRALYLPVIRNNVYDVFQLFDFVDPAVPTGDRSATTVAPQALFMMNSDLVLQAADKLAAGVAGEPDAPARVRALYRRAYGRLPSPAEIARAESLLQRADEALRASQPDPAKRRLQTLALLCQTLLAASEFIYLG